MSLPQPSIHVVRFWTKFKPDPKDAARLNPVDMVAYGPVGQTQKTLVHTEVKRLSQVQNSDDEQNNPAIAMARLRWDIIRPHYDAWKAGQEMPLIGTPLAAWNAIQPEQAEVLKSRGIKTVEDIATLTDAAIEGIPVPHMRDLKRNAQRFLDSAETTRFAAVLAEKDRLAETQQVQLMDQASQISALVAQVNQLADMVAARQADEGDETDKAGRKGKSKAA